MLIRMSTTYGLWLAICVLSITVSPTLSQTQVIPPIIKTSIGDIEIFHLFSTLVLFVWIMFLMALGYGIYLLIPNTWSLKARLEGGRDLQIAHTFMITIIATEPSVGYDFDNSSLRIDLSDKNDDLIASLLMRPLWAFHSIQTNTTSISSSTLNRPKASPTSDVTDNETNNLSRQVPMIGIYKLITNKQMNKVTKVVIAHDCPHPDSTILIRCIEITNITSLTAHTYPINAYIPYLSQPMVFNFKSTAKYEFDSSHEISRKMRYQANSTLNVIERSAFWLLSINMIVLGSFFWSESFAHESDPWLMWYKAVLLSLILGSLVATLHLILTVPFRLFKEYYIFHSKSSVNNFKFIVICIVVLAAAILSMASFASAYEYIKLSILLRWYRIAFLSTLFFICLCLVFTLIGRLVHVKPKARDRYSFRRWTLDVPPMNNDKHPNYEMLELDTTSVEIANPKNLMFFASEWLRTALDQHKGLDKAILCDIYDVMYLPNQKIITNSAKNAIKIFGEENIKETNKGKAYATRAIEQKGMAVSVSQYGKKYKKTKKNDNKDDTENNGLVLFVDDLNSV